MKSPVPISKESAISLTKWRIQQMLTDGTTKLGLMERVALQGAINGNTLDRLYEQVYDVMGAAISLDAGDERHRQWLEAGSAVPLQ
jgi:hypothetical protein